MDYSGLFREFVEESGVEEHIDLIRRNSQGKIWIIGGYVYKNIVGLLRDKKPDVHDLDFLVENPASGKTLDLPDDWEIGFTRYGSPYFLNEKGELIDLNFLSSFHSIIRRGLHRTIESFLSGTPLTIQSIAYDVDRREIMGDVGIRAIEESVVRINDPEEAKYEVEGGPITLKEYVEKKSREIGFEYELTK